MSRSTFLTSVEKTGSYIFSVFYSTPTIAGQIGGPAADSIRERIPHVVLVYFFCPLALCVGLYTTGSNILCFRAPIWIQYWIVLKTEFALYAACLHGAVYWAMAVIDLSLNYLTYFGYCFTDSSFCLSFSNY